MLKIPCCYYKSINEITACFIKVWLLYTYKEKSHFLTQLQNMSDHRGYYSQSSNRENHFYSIAEEKGLRSMMLMKVISGVPFYSYKYAIFSTRIKLFQPSHLRGECPQFAYLLIKLPYWDYSLADEVHSQTSSHRLKQSI